MSRAGNSSKFWINPNIPIKRLHPQVDIVEILSAISLLVRFPISCCLKTFSSGKEISAFKFWNCQNLLQACWREALLAVDCEAREPRAETGLTCGGRGGEAGGDNGLSVSSPGHPPPAPAPAPARVMKKAGQVSQSSPVQWEEGGGRRVRPAKSPLAQRERPAGQPAETVSHNTDTTVSPTISQGEYHTSTTPHTTPPDHNICISMSGLKNFKIWAILKLFRKKKVVNIFWGKS